MLSYYKPEFLTLLEQTLIPVIGQLEYERLSKSVKELEDSAAGVEEVMKYIETNDPGGFKAVLTERFNPIKDVLIKYVDSKKSIKAHQEGPPND